MSSFIRIQSCKRKQCCQRCNCDCSILVHACFSWCGMLLKQSWPLDGGRQGPPGDRLFRITVFLGALPEGAWVGVPLLSNLGSRSPAYTSLAPSWPQRLPELANASGGSCQSHGAESGATRGKSCQCCTACLVAFARVEQEEWPVRVMGRCRPASQG